MKKQYSLEPVPYVLEEDRVESADEQVTFWIKPLKLRESVQMVSDLSGVSRAQRGKVRVNKQLLLKSELDGWLGAVAKVDNYPPSDDFAKVLSDKIQIKELLDDQGRISTTEDPDVLIAIAYDLLQDQRDEIIEVRSSYSRLSEGTRKK